MDSAPPVTFSRCLFLRLLALVYLVAFVSLWVQVDGLVGRNGILPAVDFLDAVRSQTGAERYWLVPTFFWLAPGDATLHLLCGGGMVLSLLVLFGVAPAPCLVLLWAFYLSLSAVCRTFLSFQWDALLLETGFLAVFLAPLRMRCRWRCPEPAPWISLWLMRWLLFRLMFSSGIVKILSGDPTWRNLTALRYHYETQPLPTWTSWYVHQLPGWFHSASLVVMFVVELVVPFLIFAPRRLRHAAGIAMIAFQLLIAATGNFAFFNLLTIALCVLLFDDGAWRRRARASIPTGGHAARWPAPLLVPIGALLLAASLAPMARTLDLRPRWIAPLGKLDRALGPFEIANAYGLFAVMTTSRPEIVIEGSDDGENWKSYEFRWKPGDLKRRPSFVAPHQPRLDWQMWFAALGSYRSNPWFGNLLVRLLQGSPEVLALLDHNPFPSQPPRFVRAVLHDYHFSDPATRRAEGVWWRREPLGLYCPVLSLPALSPSKRFSRISPSRNPGFTGGA